MYSYGSPHTAVQKQDDQHERTFSSYVRIQVVVLKTCLGRWTIGRSGERGSGISVLPARYDDDDDDDSRGKNSSITSFVHIPEFDMKRLTKAEWRINRNHVNIRIKGKTIVWILQVIQILPVFLYIKIKIQIFSVKVDVYIV